MRLIIHAVYDSCDFFNGIPILLCQVFQLSACFRETNNRIFIRILSSVKKVTKNLFVT